MSDVQNQVKADAAKVEASAVHAENRFLTTIKDNAAKVAVAGIVLALLCAALVVKGVL